MAFGVACNEDNVLRAIQHQSAVGSLNCQYLLSIPFETFITTTVITTLTVSSKTKTINNPGTLTVTAPEVISTITMFTTTYVPYLPTYVSQYPEARVSSACSCIPISIKTEVDTKTLTTHHTVSGTETITKYAAVTTTTPSDFQFIPATKTHPAICNPSFLSLNFATANAQRPVSTITPSPGSHLDDESCCISCFNAKNCLYWSNNLNDSKGNGCKIVVGTTEVADLVLNVCPLGIQDKGGLSKPGATGLAFNAGPCFHDDFEYLMTYFP